MDNSVVKRITLLGVPIDLVQREAMPKVVLSLLVNEQSNKIVFLNLPKLLAARGNAEFKTQLNEAALVLPVSKSLTHGIKLLYNFKAERYLPYDYIITLLTLLEQKRKSVYLLGGSSKVLQKADKNLRSSYPHLLFVGRYKGYFKKQELGLITEAIRKASPTLLITARGLKGKEQFIFQQQHSFKPGICLYLPDFFDVVAGKKAKPNREAFHKGSDWLGKLIKNPLRVMYIFILLRYQLLLVYYRLAKKEG
ncbi:MAG: WecB/TagA/CpsF family glycosyltransferase [Spirochaetaceae bacterium]|nr:WecB/TagA/CpsF family glycosyltransferase [Spirochaetaceae bacterium]